MISKADIQKLLHQQPNGSPVLSLFLDMSVNSENKRTYQIFLNQRRNQFPELDGDRDRHHREALGAALERVDRWLTDEYREANKGAVLYTQVGGDWFEALQFPVPVRNRLTIEERPVIGPLVEILEGNGRYGVLLVDREHLRMISVYLGTAIHEHEVRTEPYPAPHDVKRGGYSAADYQRRKSEEVRHFFKEFAQEVAEFDRRYRHQDLIVLGTEENVQNFLDFLPQPVREKVAHTAQAPVDAPTAHVLERLAPFFTEAALRREAEAVDRLRDRARTRHFATFGFHDTLVQLQEGKLDRLIVSRGLERAGAQCTNCGFYLAGRDGACPYCGGDIRDEVDLVEAMVRLAAAQDLPVDFVGADVLTDLDGVGALLKF
jgi:peptide chain release factor subunit 1